MSAPEAAVAAVMEALGCDVRPYVGRMTGTRRPICVAHRAWATDRGCPVAVAAAQAAVDAARPSIQAETLREAADEIESHARRWLSRVNGKGRSNRQRARFAVRGNKAAATLRCAQSLRMAAESIKEAS